MRSMKHMLRYMKENRLKSQISTRDIHVALNVFEKIMVLLVACLSGVVVGGAIWVGINWLLHSLLGFADLSLKYSPFLVMLITTIFSCLIGLMVFVKNYRAYRQYKLKMKLLKEKNKFAQDGEKEIDEQMRSAMSNYFNVLLQKKILEKEKSLQLNEEEIFSDTILSYPELHKTLSPLANQLYDELKMKNDEFIQEMLRIDNQKQIDDLFRSNQIKYYREKNLNQAINQYIDHHRLKKFKSNEKKPGPAKVLMTTLTSFLKTTALLILAPIAITAIAVGSITWLGAAMLAPAIGGSLFAASSLVGLVIGGVAGLFQQRLGTSETSLANQEAKNLKLLEVLDAVKTATKHSMDKLLQRDEQHEMIERNESRAIAAKKHEAINTPVPDKEEPNPDEERQSFSPRK